MEGKTPPINFTTLSEGLGFHPFADGLPYAPVTKARTSTTSDGTGAVSAGPPRIARVNIPIAPARAPMVAPAATVQPQPPARAPLKETAAAAPARVFQEKFGFIYLMKRTLAYLMDSTVNVGLCLIALAFALQKQNLRPEALFHPGVVVLSVLFLAAFNWAVVTAQEVAFGTTLGKRVFGIEIHGGAAATFLRAFFFLASVAFGGAGLLWALFNSKRRCWHDVIVDLQPTEIARL